MNNKLSPLSKIFLGISALLLIVSLFVPIWRIELDAPQYPEGLELKIWANRIAGDVEIINGLNHYIGMKELHTQDFLEFTILPYLIGFFILLFAVSAFSGKKKWLYGSLFAFIVFGIVSMIDFYIWEYNYGHNLDPNAAIQVPGMAYQPPLIGFKQLLNFGAFSVPDIGGWLFVVAGGLLLFASIKEKREFGKKTQGVLTVFVLAAVFSTAFASCGGEVKPEPIRLNKDKCGYCRMTISDGQFGTELITQKGRIYKFDDISCLFGYTEDNAQTGFKSYYVNDYMQNNELIDATTAWYVSHSDIRSPMGGNIAAFGSKESAEEYAAKFHVSVLTWEEIKKDKPTHHHNHHHEH